VSKSSALSERHEGYKHQLKKLDAELEGVVAPYDTAMRFIQSENFLSSLANDLNHFMHIISLIMSRVITSPTFGGAFPMLPSLGGPISPAAVFAPTQPPPIQPEDRRYLMLRTILAIVIAAGAIVSYYMRVNTIGNILATSNSTNITTTLATLNSAFPSTGNELLIGFTLAGAVILGPELFEALGKRLGAIPEKGKGPITLARMVSDKLGMSPGGMMRLYAGAFFISRHRPMAREHYILKYRAEFPATLGEVMVLVKDAYGQRRTELLNLMRDITRPTSAPQM